MKGWLIGLLILATGTISCRTDDDIRIDLLYRTWQQTHQINSDGQTVAITPHSSYILTFRTNGTILYGADGTYPVCCSPIQFNRKGNTLDLADVASIPIPADVPIADCSAVRCISPGNAWQIVTLSLDQLVIKKDRETAIYRPYP